MANRRDLHGPTTNLTDQLNYGIGSRNNQNRRTHPTRRQKDKPFSTPYIVFLSFICLISILVNISQILLIAYSFIQGWVVVFWLALLAYCLSYFGSSYISDLWLKDDLSDGYSLKTKFCNWLPIIEWSWYRIKTLINHGNLLNLTFEENAHSNQVKHLESIIKSETADLTNLKLLKTFTMSCLMLPFLVYMYLEYYMKNYNESPMFCFSEYEIYSQVVNTEGEIEYYMTCLTNVGGMVKFDGVNKNEIPYVYNDQVEQERNYETNEQWTFIGDFICWLRRGFNS